MVGEQSFLESHGQAEGAPDVFVGGFSRDCGLLL